MRKEHDLEVPCGHVQQFKDYDWRNPHHFVKALVMGHRVQWA